MMVYISLPITCSTDAPERAEKAEKLLQNNNFAFVNPLKLNHQYAHSLEQKYLEEGMDFTPEIEDDIWEAYLNTCLIAVKECDGILLTNGWRKSRGCRLEVLFALSNNITLFDAICHKISFEHLRIIHKEIMNGDGHTITPEMAKQTAEDYGNLIIGNQLFESKIKPQPVCKY